MDDAQISERYSAAQAIAREAGDLAMGYFRERHTLVVTSKGAQDRVSNADLAVESLIRERLAARFPNDGFLGEESGQQGGDSAGTWAGTWVVDPIDGTDSFVNGIPVWSTSIAFVVDTDVEIGVVYDPNAEEFFSVRRGHGAFLDRVPLRPSAATSFAEGIVGVGYSTRTDPASTVQAIARLLDAGGMFQRNGSGALMITYVAAGRLIGYYEAHINSWDCLAGLAMVREAEGWANDFLAGDGLTSGNVIVVAAPGLAGPMRRMSGLT